MDFWDGTDDDGHPVEPGTYRVRGLCHPPLDVLYEFAYGNPGNPPYQNAAGTGGWLANHDNPMAVAADEQRIYIAAPQSEGATTLLAVDYHGQRQWGHGNISGGPMVRHGKYLYMLVGGDMYHPFVPEGEVHVTRLDPADGKYLPFADGKYSHKIAEIPADMAQWPGYKPRRPEGETVAAHGFDADWCLHQNMGLAAARDRLYASIHYQDQIVVVDPDKGEAVGQISLERPAGLAADARGAVYAISGKRVVKLARGGAAGDPHRRGPGGARGPGHRPRGKPLCLRLGRGDVRPSVLASGQAAAHDRTRGRPAACRGLRSPRHVPALGPGRRSPGPFMGGGVRHHPAPHQRLEHPHRPVRARVLRHHLVRGGGAHVNPLNPRQAFVLGNTCELDWEKGLWRVTGTLCRPTCRESLFGLDHEGQKMEVVRHRGTRSADRHRRPRSPALRNWAPSAPNPWRPWGRSPPSGNPATHGPTWS